MSRVVVIGAQPQSLTNFRGELLRSLVEAGHEVTAMSGDGDPSVVSRLAAMTVRFRPFPVHRSGMNPFGDFQTFLELRKALREIEPDVVLAYTIKPVIWSGFALRGLPGPRFFALITGLGIAFQGRTPARRILLWFVTWLYRASLSRASGVIFQNPDDQNVFVSRRIVQKSECAIVDGSGVDLQRFACSPLPRGSGVVFLTVGRLLGAKGLRVLAEAARLVKIVHPTAVFRLVGPEDPSPDGIPVADVLDWHARGWLEYLGASQDVRPHLAACHVFVLPSFREGIPRSTLEAMAMGRPILTTDVPGCRETVIPGENGHLVLPADAKALAEGMIWFIEHRAEWERMGARSRQIAETRFDVRAVNRSLMQIMGVGQAVASPCVRWSADS